MKIEVVVVRAVGAVAGADRLLFEKASWNHLDYEDSGCCHCDNK